MQDDDINQQDQEIQGLLKDYPMPAADAGFYDRALVRATHEGSRRQRNRWLLAGFGGAMAATLAVWVIGGMLFSTPDLPDSAAAIPGVVIAIEEPRTVTWYLRPQRILMPQR